MSDTMHMTCGMDIGNGYVKAKVSVDGSQPRLVDLPSVVTYVSPATPWIPREPNDELMADLVNELDCTISSKAIKQQDRGRILVGERSVASGDTQVMFNIDDHVPKCDDSLSYQLALSVIASEAVRVTWERTHVLPSDVIHVACAMGVALPISDYMDWRETYRDRFCDGEHRITIHDFEQEVTVSVTFAKSDVVVLAEGAAAQYAISDMGEPFLEAALRDTRARGIPCDPEETGASLASYKSTVGVDIGEGTVNFPVFRDGNISVENSSSINTGYGTVLSKVVVAERNSASAPRTRKELSEFLLDPNPSPTKRRLRKRYQRLVDEEIQVFVRDVISEYKRVLARVKLDCDVVYVYGGGAAPVRDTLLPQLVEASKLDEDVYIPVIYLDSSYSRDLNRNGLYLVAQIARSAR